MCKYIFVSGGVVSGLGKGITMAAIGRLLKERGIKVSALKMDPYMNIDPGTMSPLQHGEVFVTNDGAETDLDLGHYERFMDVELNQYSNITSGRIYWEVLSKERKGDYLGNTVQVIPHITSEIKRLMKLAAQHSGCDVLLCEIGGTVGDIESQPFLEAVRQMFQESARDQYLCLHVTLVPYVNASQEFKSKPTQHSVKQLQSYGIMPDIIIARSEKQLPKETLRKISSFCNMEESCVISNYDQSSLSEVVPMLHEAGISELIKDKLQLTYIEQEDITWEALLNKGSHASQTVHVGIIGKYVSLHDAYLSVVEALHHAAIDYEAKLILHWIDSEELEHQDVVKACRVCDAIVIPGGFGQRGIKGMLLAVQYAREHEVPLLGICLGMQVMCIEFARNVLGFKAADSTEFQQTTQHPIITMMDEQYHITQIGGTMRLGAYPCTIQKDSHLYTIYQQQQISERHRHRYEFHHDYLAMFEAHGMLASGRGTHGLVEAVELKEHPFYIGVQFHPEFQSRPNRPHPLFLSLIRAAL